MESTIDSTLSLHQAQELLAKLETEGLTVELAQEIIDSRKNGLTRRVLEFARSQIPTSYEKAQYIMGENFFGNEEARQCFGIPPGNGMDVVPFSEELLKKSKDDHILVAVYPLSMEDVYRSSPEGVFDFRPLNDYFFTDNGTDQVGRWCLIRISGFPIPSKSRTYAEEMETLGKDEMIHSARVMVYAIAAHYMNTGTRLFKDIVVATSTRYSPEHSAYAGNIAVGYFKEERRRGGATMFLGTNHPPIATGKVPIPLY